MEVFLGIVGNITSVAFVLEGRHNNRLNLISINGGLCYAGSIGGANFILDRLGDDILAASCNFSCFFNSFR